MIAFFAFLICLGFGLFGITLGWNLRITHEERREMRDDVSEE